MSIPFVFSACSDAYVALGRIGEFLTAEELGEPYSIEAKFDSDGEEAKWGVKVEGDFTWESISATPDKNKDKSGGAKEKTKSGSKKDKNSKDDRGTFGAKTKGKSHLQIETTFVNDEPFKLTNLNLWIPRGSFVAIVGCVGSGKSSLLQAMIGEMRKLSGQVRQIQTHRCFTLNGPVFSRSHFHHLSHMSLKHHGL